jgi:hypothetical protein
MWMMLDGMVWYLNDQTENIKNQKKTKKQKNKKPKKKQKKFFFVFLSHWMLINVASFFLLFFTLLGSLSDTKDNRYWLSTICSHTRCETGACSL